MNKLPNDWQIKTIKEVCNIYTGNSINKQKKEKNFVGLKEGLNYIGTKDISFDNIIDYDNGVKIPFKDLKDFKVAKSNSALLCIEGGSAGRKIGFTNKDICFGNKLCCFEAIDNEPKFIYYYLQSDYFLEEFYSNIQGLIGGITKKKIRQIKIPLPPLETQKQIAERLDFLFDKIDKVLKLLNENKEYIKKYRLSILKSAFEGKLTHSSKNWEIKTLGDVYEITSSKRVFKKEWKKEGIPFYRARDIVSFSKNEAIKSPLFISYDMYNEYSKKYGIPSEDDILVTGVGTIGIPYLVKSDDKFYFKDGNIIWLKKKSDKIFSKYVYYLFFSNLLELNSRGSTVLTYTIIHAKNTKIPLPPLEIQKEIVSILDKKFKSMEEIERLNNENIGNLLSLKKSLLKEAFSGRL